MTIPSSGGNAAAVINFAPDLLAIKDAAARVGLAPSTMYAWACSDGRPDFFIKIGKRWKVSAIRLERYLHGESA